METISLVINDSSDVLCFRLNLINIFAKSTKPERYADVMFKLTYCLSVTAEDLNLWRRYKDLKILDSRYFIVSDSTLGAR